ncbi:MAG: SRPBCC domain-containing protein [Pirellulales bacterium]
MSSLEQHGPTLRSSRILSANPQAVFAAFEDPEQLAKWWGPDGFTNTFETFEFIPGGRWTFVMHDPDGTNYPNDSYFREIVPNSRIVIEHVVQPWFRLTVTITPHEGGTHLQFDQEFESPEVATAMRNLCSKANEQVLNRLQAVSSGCA